MATQKKADPAAFARELVEALGRDEAEDYALEQATRNPTAFFVEVYASFLPPGAPKAASTPPQATKPPTSCQKAAQGRPGKAPLLLFSYGSNSPRQLEERLGHPVRAGRGFLRDWKRIFVGHSEKWGGAPATMVPSRGDVVFGTLVEVTEEDLAKLDKYEGVPRVYQRKTVPIEGPDLGHRFTDEPPHKAVVYLATSTKEGKPSAAYAKAVEENVYSVWETQAQRRQAGPIPRGPLTIPEDMEEIALRTQKDVHLDALEEAMRLEQKENPPLNYVAWMKTAKTADDGRVILGVQRDEIMDIITRSGLEARANEEMKRKVHVSHSVPNWPHSFPEKDPGHAQARWAWKTLIKEVTELSPKNGERLVAIYDEDRIGPLWKKVYASEADAFSDTRSWSRDREAYGKKIDALAAKTKDFRELMKRAKDRVDASSVFTAYQAALMLVLPRQKKGKGGIPAEYHWSPHPKNMEGPTWRAALETIPNAAARARALELADQYPELAESARALGYEPRN